MKRPVLAILGAAAVLLMGARYAAAQERTFTGLITDEDLNCIQNPMKVPPPSQGVPAMGKDACVLYWAHFASPKEKIVLYDPDTKTTYHLDNEDIVLPYVGDAQKIQVTGTYNESTKTIHVLHVRP